MSCENFFLGEGGGWMWQRTVGGARMQRLRRPVIFDLSCAVFATF